MKEYLTTTLATVCFVFCGHILPVFAIQMKSCNTIDYVVTEDKTEIGLDVAYRSNL